MKPIHYIIAASLILNVALLIYTKPFSPAPSVPAKTPAGQLRSPTAPTPNLQTATPEQLTQQLATMGFPPDIIRSVVVDRIGKNFTDKRDSIRNADNPRYWNIPLDRLNSWTTQDYELIAAWNEHHKSIQKLISAYPATELMRQFYGDLSGTTDEQLSALHKAQYELVTQWGDLSQKLDKAGATTEDKTSQGSLLQQQYNEKIAQILTPDQLTEYGMRSSTASTYLGYSTKLFDATEQEFRDMYAVYHEYYKNTLLVSFSLSSFQDFIATEGAQLQQILGPERYADFQQAINPAYETLNRITQRLDLPISAAREVVSVQTDLVQRAAAIDADTTLTAADRAAQYNALAQEAKTRITQTLGQRGYDAYRDNSLNWIQTLESGKPPPPSAK